MHDTSLLVVGYGNMGKALVDGWLAHGTSPSHITLLGRNPITPPHPEVHCITSLDQLNTNVDAVIFAVKPQMLDDILPAYRHMDKSLFISIAAGKTLAYFAKHLGGDKAIIRTMPNLPSTIGKGVTAACANTHCTFQHTALVTDLFNAVGSTLWLDNEDDINAVTAVAGSGPAYVFYLIECMIKAGMAEGLSEKTSTSLTLETFAGAVAMAQESGDIVSHLRQRVTSKGGTTEAGLNTLMHSDYNVEKALLDTVKSAKNRAYELSD